jgi:hypothetical protein
MVNSIFCLTGTSTRRTPPDARSFAVKPAPSARRSRPWGLDRSLQPSKLSDLPQISFSMATTNLNPPSQKSLTQNF